MRRTGHRWRGRLLRIVGRLGPMAAAWILLLVSAPLEAEDRLTFIGVALDMETRQADRKLQDYIYQKAGVRFAPEELEYDRVIERLASWKNEDGYFVARATPYVYVVAEMLGAQFEALATYVSSTTGNRTYHAYFVVNRRHFQRPPDLTDVMRFLQQKPERPTFIFHSQFSTSSFFLPSLYFRSHKVFHMDESTESLIAISSQRIPENSSSKLVERVARGEADLAAVWDGTKAKFDSGPAHAIGKQVYFVRLPVALPNDLLVCSASLDRSTKDRLRTALAAMQSDEIAVGDFRTWQSITEATDAREALGDLRWMAREHALPVTVEIRSGQGADAATESWLDAARQAVRLAGTEFVLYDPDFHEHVDFTWTLEPIHDGAVVLRSAIPGSEVEEQAFRISFRDGEDLTRRIVSLIQSRMHRIRYVWSYSAATPIIIRDMAFSIPAGTVVKVQRVSWLDPDRDKFRAGPLFNADIKEAGFYTYQLDPGDFTASGEKGFDPLSNVSYRVILLREAEERLLFRLLTGLFMGLLVAAAAAAVIEMVGAWRRKAASGSPAEEP